MIGSTRSRLTAAGVVLATLAVVLVRWQFLDVATVSSDSMAPTVCTGDTVLVARLDRPTSIQVVDGRTVDEPYVDHASIDGVYTATVTVPDGMVFVMGDHRETSIDSRAYGPIPTSAINGRLLWDLPWSC